MTAAKLRLVEREEERTYRRETAAEIAKRIREGRKPVPLFVPLKHDARAIVITNIGAKAA